jgi:Ion channel
MARDDDQWPRYGLLLLSVVASVVVQGAVEPSPVQEVVVMFLLGTSLLLAFRVARVRPGLLVAAFVLAVAGLAVSVVEAFAGDVGTGETRLMSALLVALGPPAVALGIVRNLQASRTVHVEAVMGVLAFYMLLGMLFAFIFGAIDRLSGEPFFADGTDATVPKCLYYSFTTLATVGYGDLTARTDLGHTLSIFEALLGQIYLVTVVSLIVSNLGRRAARA